jgi:hypothetical protein
MHCKRTASVEKGGTLLAVNSDSIARRPIWEATPTHHLDGRRNEPPDTSSISNKDDVPSAALRK